jgi:uncharacterized protein with ParB-like and HNH nuclease domain
MKATESNFLKLLEGRKQFIIPIYQRTYSWTLEQCEQLWDDICWAAENDSVAGHFIGSIVYIEKGLYQVTSVPQLMVIDGQQRLTTIFLLLAVLGKTLMERNEEAEITRKKINNYYLFNSEETGELRYKLLLTKRDKDTLNFLLEDRDADLPSKRIVETYKFFERQVQKYTNLPLLYRGLGKLIIVDIALDRNYDNPQLIFESLNSKGLDLSQADLIRNYILMKLDKDEQEELYNNYWYKMEDSFRNSEVPDIFDRFIRDYLTVKTGRICKIDEIYSSFKKYVQKKEESIQQIVSDILCYSRYYAKFVLTKEEDKELNIIFRDINTLKVDVAYPFLLTLYDDYERQILSRDEFINILKLVESYVFRRAICEIPTNSLNKTFADLGREIEKENYLESVQAAFLYKDSYKRFPRDEEFRKKFVAKDVYNFRNRNYLLRKLENYGRKEEVIVGNYTIEHIIPQNKNLSLDWRKELGENWEEVHSAYLHTIGNLTLTGYNSELNDRPFIEKRDLEGGFANSPLQLNKSLARLEHWNGEEILKRANILADLALKIWPCPAPDFINKLPSVSVREMVASVFPIEEDFIAARSIIQQIIDILAYDDIKHILSFTYRDGKRITANLGQWLILRFERSDDSFKVIFSIDLGVFNNLETIGVYRTESFDERWTKGKDIKLAYFQWDHGMVLPESFFKSWHSVILHAYAEFHKWKSSSYMRYNQPELAAVLLGLE